MMKRLESMDEQSRTELLSKVDADRSELTSALITQLGSSTSKHVKAASIYLIGRYRLADGVPDLIREIDLEVESPLHAGREPLWERYPAMEALIAIGQPSIRPTIELLATDKDNLRRELATKVIRYVQGYEVARFILTQASAAQSDTNRKRNLQDALTCLEKLPRD